MNLLCQSAWDKPKFISFPWISLVERNKQTHERLRGQSIKDKQLGLPCLQHSTIHSWHNALFTADESWVPLTVYMRHFPLLINNTLRHLNSVIWGSNSFSPGREQSTIFWLTLIPTTSDSAANLPGVYWRSRSSDANRSDANRTISYANSTDQARKSSLSLGCTLRSYQIEWWTQSANLVEPRPAKNIFDFCYIKLDGV